MSLTEVITKGKYGYAHGNMRGRPENKFEDGRRTDSGSIDRYTMSITEFKHSKHCRTVCLKPM